jgi:hypothetical protein
MKRSGSDTGPPTHKRAYRSTGDDDDDEQGLFDDECGIDDVAFEKIDAPDTGDGTENEEVKWNRPDSDQILNPNDTSICFQWLDADSLSGEPLDRNPDGKNIVGSSEGIVPIVRLYGVTQAGHSVLAYVHGFTPYFYASFGSSTDLTDALLGQLRVQLDQRVSALMLSILEFVRALISVCFVLDEGKGPRS